VDGKVAQLGDRVNPQSLIRVDGHIIHAKTAEEAMQRVIIYHKPVGEVSARNDPQGRATIFDNLPKLSGLRWVQVGRLDINTSGLMLFTTDGELAHRLMHPSNEFVREYAVRVRGQLTTEQMKSLREGVVLEDGPAHFDSIEDAGGNDEGVNHWYKVTLKEGKYRMVRRLFDSQGLEVSRLIRTRFAEVKLPPELHQGRWMDLDASEVTRLLGQVSLTGKQYTGLYGRARLRHSRGDGDGRPPQKRRNPCRR
jgi:23S rRNA pseudouridine2605 synthase